MIFHKKRNNIRQFNCTIKYEGNFLGIVKHKHKVEESTHWKAEQTLDFILTKPKEKITLDQSVIIPKK